MAKRINFRMLKLVMCDCSHIMDYFMKHPKETQNLFVFFHLDVAMAEQEKLFSEYMETLNSLLSTYCHNRFWVETPSYESYMNELQIRYRIVKKSSDKSQS